MGLSAENRNEKYTYGDYVKWSDKERWELIDGTAYNMCAASNTSHQVISMKLSYLFYDYLKDKTCQVFAAPFDVRLGDYKSQSDIDIPTVVQPDISVICDPEKIDDAGGKGAPDLIIEILSPSTGW